MNICKRFECSKVVLGGGRGLCKSHYQKLRRAVKRKATTWRKLQKAGLSFGKVSHVGRMKTYRVLPKESPTVLDIAWTAGIYEGEGSCTPTKRGSLVAKISQKQPWILRKLQRFFGGSVYFYSGHKKTTPIWNFVLSGTLARGFLMTIYSLLSPHRQKTIRKVLRNK